MRYAKIVDGVVSKYPITGTDILLENPGTSFPAGVLSEATMASYNCLPVAEVPEPQFNSGTHRAAEEVPVLLDGAWTQQWVVVPLTPDEIAQQVAQRDSMRAEAYRTESDPLFFKSQRGEATHEEWLAKVAEIKSRYA